MLTEVTLRQFLNVVLQYRKTFKLVDLSAGVSRFYYDDECRLIGVADIVFGHLYYFLFKLRS